MNKIKKFQIVISILLEDKRFMDALNYIQNKFYWKPYRFCADDRDNKNQCVYTDAVIYNEEFPNGKTKIPIFRPNNGLAHAHLEVLY